MGYRRSSLILLITAAASGMSSIPRAAADAFTLGAGPTWSQMELPLSSTQTAIFAGPGFVADFRIRASGTPVGEAMGVDILAQFAKTFGSNIASGVAETSNVTAYGGGIDLWFRSFFFGGRYLSNQATIKTESSGTASELEFGSMGYRAGVNWITSDTNSLQLFGFYDIGIASSASSAQGVRSYGAGLILHLKLLKSGF